MGKFQARIYCSWHSRCKIKYPARLIMNNVILMSNISGPLAPLLSLSYLLALFYLQAPLLQGAMTRWSPGPWAASLLTSSRGWPPPGRGRPSPARPGPLRGRDPATSWRPPSPREQTGPRRPARVRSARKLTFVFLIWWQFYILWSAGCCDQTHQCCEAC